MENQKLLFLAACLLILKVTGIYGQSIATSSSESVAISGSGAGGCGQLIIPAVIKPVIQPGCAAASNILDYSSSGIGSYGGYGTMPPPIIVEEDGDDNFQNLLFLIFAMRGFGNNCGCGNNGCGGGCNGYNGCGGNCGGFNGCGGNCGGYNGCGGNCGGYSYNSGCGCGSCNGGSNYGSCGCGYCDDGSSCGSTPPEICILLKTDGSTTTSNT